MYVIEIDTNTDIIIGVTDYDYEYTGPHSVEKREEIEDPWGLIGLYATEIDKAPAERGDLAPLPQPALTRAGILDMIVLSRARLDAATLVEDSAIIAAENAKLNTLTADYDNTAPVPEPEFEIRLFPEGAETKINIDILFETLLDGVEVTSSTIFTCENSEQETVPMVGNLLNTEIPGTYVVTGTLGEYEVNLPVVVTLE